MLYWGHNQKRYELGTRIGGGGEGEVYEIAGQSDKLAKIYKSFANSTARAEKHEKLKAMLSMGLPSGSGGRTLLAWPMDTLCDKNGDFVGYIMPRVRNKKPLYSAVLPSERSKLFENDYSWKMMPRLAYNLASMVASLHKAGVVIGDMNADNFMVDKDGFVTFIDTDSYTVTSGGKTYKCKASAADVLAPELQGKNLRLQTSVFTKQTDNFGLAIHLWMILNNGVHPFCLPPQNRRSSCFNPAVTNIASGYSVLAPGAHRNADQPPLDMLPDYIMQLFRRMFCYDAFTACKPETIRQRPSAAEFVSALERLIKEPTERCRKDSMHTYLSTCRHCPWCEIERGQIPPPKPVSHQAQTAQTNHATSRSPVNTQTFSPTYSSYTPDRSKVPLLVASSVVGLIFLLLYYKGFTVGAGKILDTALPSSVGFIGLAIATGIAVAVIYIGFGSHYEDADGDEAWLWLLSSLLTPILGLLIAYAATIFLALLFPIALLCLICCAVANM